MRVGLGAHARVLPKPQIIFSSLRNLVRLPQFRHFHTPLPQSFSTSITPVCTPSLSLNCKTLLLSTIPIFRFRVRFFFSVSFCACVYLYICLYLYICSAKLICFRFCARAFGLKHVNFLLAHSEYDSMHLQETRFLNCGKVSKRVNEC